MKFAVAPDKYALKKRVDRFFYGSTLCRQEVYNFVDLLTQKRELNTYAFGGLVRDIGLFSIRDFYSDIDLVVDASACELEEALMFLPASCSIQKNKFGGYRVLKQNWEFDIWCAEDTWAIKNNFVPYKGIESLLDTTFLSWDSALFDLKRRKLICHEDYLTSLVTGKIDVVLRNTPNELGSFVRLARAIYSKGAHNIGPKAVETLQSGLETYCFKSIMDHERESYQMNYLNVYNLTALQHAIELHWCSSSHVQINSYY